MLRDNSQLKLSLSPYQGIYEVIIPANHLLRRIKENVDFSFVNPMLRKQYCEHFGRPAKEPEMMFKLLFLKKLYDLSFLVSGICDSYPWKHAFTMSMFLYFIINMKYASFVILTFFAFLIFTFLAVFP